MTQTVLVADDSQTIRKIVEMALKGSPYQVVGVGRAGEVLPAAQHSPAVILLDYYMPDGSGYELCRSLKSSQATSHIPVVMLGGSYKNFDESMARQVGADAVLMKPFKTDSLLESISSVAGRGGVAPQQPGQSDFGRQSSGFAQQPGSSGLGQQPGQSAFGNQGVSRPRIPQPPSNQPRIPQPPGNTGSHTPLPRTGSGRDPGQSGLGAAGQSSPPPPTPDLPSRGAGGTGGTGGGAAGGSGLSQIPRLELEKMVREEVKKIVRQELPELLRSVMGEVFQQKLLPRLQQHGQQQIETIMTNHVNRRIQEQVRSEIERLLSEG